MSIDIEVGIRYKNVPADNNYANEILVKALVGCLSIICICVNTCLHVCLVWVVFENINTLPTLMCQLKQQK